MNNIIIRKNNMFVIDKKQLKPEARKDEVCNALYYALYKEFTGASKNPKYQGVDYKTMMQKINEFASEWLKERGLL